MNEVGRLTRSLAAVLLAIASGTAFGQAATWTPETARAEVARRCPADPPVQRVERICSGLTKLGQCFDALQAHALVTGSGHVDADTDYVAAEAEAIFKQEAFSPLAPGLAGLTSGLERGLALDAVTASRPLSEPHTLGLSLLPKLTVRKDFRLLTMGLGAYVNPSPMVNPLLERQLANDGRADLARQLESDAEPWDDVIYESRISINGPYFGHDFRWHVDDLSRLTKTALAGHGMRSLAELDGLLSTLSREPLQRPGNLRAVACIAQLMADGDARVRSGVRDARLTQFGLLVRNQPRLDFTYRRLRRDAALGADSNSFRVSLNSGLVNINTLKASRACDRQLNGTQCPARYAKAMDRFFVRHGLSFGGYYEWGDVLDLQLHYQAALPAPVPNAPAERADRLFTLSGGEYRRWGLGTGLLVTLPDAEAPDADSSRVDLIYERTEYGRAALRLDYAVWRLTWTLRRGDLSFPLHLAYQTRTEFETDEVAPVSAAFGVQYSAW